MKFSELDLLLMMNDDDINYDHLSEDILATLALELEPYIASSALVELSARESTLLIPISQKILSNPLSDQFLQATALEILFEAEANQAMTYMLEYALHGGSYLLDAIIDLMIRYERYFTSDLGQRLVKMVQDRLDRLKDESMEIELGEEFTQLYGRIGQT